MSFAELSWLWIPITLWAAFAQTIRNAAQRHLVPLLGTLGATLVRFLYGFPFAALWLVAVSWVGGYDWPQLSAAFLLWTVTGAASQIGGTALLLRVMQERSFAAGVGWSKTEVLQVAIFAIVLLGEPLSLSAALGVVLATVGVLLLTSAGGKTGLEALMSGWTSRAALFGVASGAGFAISAVCYRGAALSLTPLPAAISAAWTLAIALFLQILMLGGWLLVRDLPALIRTLKAWRASLLAGFMGAAASAGWFTAMAMEPVAHVRTLGVVELVFSYVVSQRLFHERLGTAEKVGLVLLALGLVGVLNTERLW